MHVNFGHLLILHYCTGDYDYIVEEIKKAAKSVEEVVSVSEVQVLYSI